MKHLIALNHQRAPPSENKYGCYNENELNLCDFAKDVVILAPADQDNLVDALAAAPLAGQENAPILLTYKNSLNSDVKAKIASLGAKKVYLIGALNDSVRDEVASMPGVHTEALKVVVVGTPLKRLTRSFPIRRGPLSLASMPCLTLCPSVLSQQPTVMLSSWLTQTEIYPLDKAFWAVHSTSSADRA